MRNATFHYCTSLYKKLPHTKQEKTMSQPITKLLGKELSCLASGEKFSTPEVVKGDGAIIGLLFAADEDLSTEHSEQLKDLRDSLVQLHGELQKRSDVSFEVVFVSLNTHACQEESTTAIKHFFSPKDCTFFIISSEKAGKIQEHLVRKYGIQKGPSLILIDGLSADVIVFDGKEKVLQDPKGTNFPWKYPLCPEILSSGPLLRRSSLEAHLTDRPQSADLTSSSTNWKVVEFKSVLSPITGLLFAAFWCPPCRSFLTALTDVYKRVNKDEKKLEIVYVSSDRSQDSFDRFFASMPWLAIPFEDEKRRDTLTKAFNVKAIPNLTLLDKNGAVITTEGRLEINDDFEGIEFPWYARLVDELRDRHSTTLNNSLCVIYFTDDTETDYEVAENMLNPIAGEFANSTIEEACEPKFFIAADSDLAESLRIFMDLDESSSHLVIMDIAHFRYAVKDAVSKEVTESSIREFLISFQSEKLIYKYIQSRFV